MAYDTPLLEHFVRYIILLYEVLALDVAQYHADEAAAWQY